MKQINNWSCDWHRYSQWVAFCITGQATEHLDHWLPCSKTHNHVIWNCDGRNTPTIGLCHSHRFKYAAEIWMSVKHKTEC